MHVIESFTSATALVGTAPTLPLSRMSTAPEKAHCHPESWPWASRPFVWKRMGTLSTLRVMPHSHVYECACAPDQKRLLQRSVRALGPLGRAAVVLQVVRVTVSAWPLWSGRRGRMVGRSDGGWSVGRSHPPPWALDLLNFIKNDILKNSEVGFSSSSYFWLAVWARTGFRGNFKYFNELMQKRSFRGRGNDHFRHSQSCVEPGSSRHGRRVRAASTSSQGCMGHQWASVLEVAVAKPIAYQTASPGPQWLQGF